jgi:hypothetical protein
MEWDANLMSVYKEIEVGTVPSVGRAEECE